MRRAAGLLLLAAAASCAQPGSPPGGDIDRLPPRVVAVSPEPFDTIRDLSRPVVFRFDERLSERLEGVGDLRDAVLVSPLTGEVRAKRGRSTLEVSLAGGWRPDLVYRVVVLPVFRDLFQNIRVEPIELVFSTGAPISEIAVAGFVSDRITGEPVAGARVRAAHQPDSTSYVAQTDTAGFFALRYVPPGDYALEAWLDQDRDGTPDFFEPAGRAAVEVTAGDTAVLELALLPGDSTSARLARAEPVDSVTIRLLFDDYFAPGPVAGNGEVLRFADSARVSQGLLLHGTRLDSLEDARRPADSLAADTAAFPDMAPDRVQVPEGPPARARPAGAPRPAGADGAPPLPSRELLLLLPRPLTPDSVYIAVVDGVTNIHGIAGGGGSARFQMPPPPPPDTTPAVQDTAAAPPGGTDPGANDPGGMGPGGSNRR